MGNNVNTPATNATSSPRVDKSAFKRYLITHKTTSYCSNCRKSKVIENEMRYHRELVEATRSSVLDDRGLDPIPVNDVALQEAVDEFLPPLEPEPACVPQVQYDATILM